MIKGARNYATNISACARIARILSSLVGGYFI